MCAARAAIWIHKSRVPLLASRDFVSRRRGSGEHAFGFARAGVYNRLFYELGGCTSLRAFFVRAFAAVVNSAGMASVRAKRRIAGRRLAHLDWETKWHKPSSQSVGPSRDSQDYVWDFPARKRIVEPLLSCITSFAPHTPSPRIAFANPDRCPTPCTRHQSPANARAAVRLQYKSQVAVQQHNYNRKKRCPSPSYIEGRWPTRNRNANPKTSRRRSSTRRRRRRAGPPAASQKKSKGIKWKYVAFLALLFGSAILPVVLWIVDHAGGLLGTGLTKAIGASTARMGLTPTPR